ncbi:hypothetical protein TNCT_76671 [Trichonephila clavata]|uniref:Uncharacterized protein n=1 Tax=Trichonephila clavata TaxID=2740835 RepID=A0A8X6J1N1_TRICU|nr:hypothetical protein TNCT_76671 [Trichonephila clavata]
METISVTHVASFQTISLQVLRTYPNPVPLELLQVALSDLAKSSGKLKAKFTVRPPASRRAAMPEEATATAMSFSFLTKAEGNQSKVGME